MGHRGHYLASIRVAELPSALSFPVVKSKTTFDYIRHSRLQQGLEPPGRTQLGRTQPGRTQLVLQVEEAVPQVHLSLCILSWLGGVVCV